MNRKHISAAGALAVTVIFLGLALRNVHIRGLWEVLSSARWRWLPLMLGIIVLDIAIRAWRWRILLSRAATPSIGLLFRLEAVGLAVNNVLFMRLGEVARAFLASRELNIPLMTALCSVAVERALDMAALLALFCLASANSPFVPVSIRQGVFLVFLGMLLALSILIFSECRLGPGGSWEKQLRRWPKIHHIISQLAAGAAILREPRWCATAVFLSLILWACDAVLYWAGALALGLGGAVTYQRSVLVLSWAGAGAALPAAPGAFGTLEAMIKSLLVDMGVSPHEALAYAFFCHVIMYLVVTFLGLAFLYRIGLSLGELHSAINKHRQTVP